MNSSNTQISEYQNAIKLLGGDDSLIHNYALEETIRLMENLSPDEETDTKVIKFAIGASQLLLDFQWNYYDDSTSAQLEFFLHAMSSVLHTLSKSASMIDKDTRASLYKSVSKFWGIYRNTKYMNANIMFSLREIRTCLRKIKDDRSNADHAVRIGSNLFDVVVSVVQKEYLAAFGSLINTLNFEYTAGEWYYYWKTNRDKYFTLHCDSLKDNFELKRVTKFFKKLFKYSNKEFEKIKRKNTAYKNFEYKLLKTGGAASGYSLPDNIDTLLIGYLSLIQRLLEEFYPQIKKHISKIIAFCNEIVEVHIKKQLTFKTVEVLYFIKENCEDKTIKNEIESNFNKWSNDPIDTPSRPLSAPVTPSRRPSLASSRRLSIMEIPKKVKKKVTRKRIIDDVIMLFEQRTKINKNITEIKGEYDKICESFEGRDVEGIDEILSKLKEILQQKKDGTETNKEQERERIIEREIIFEREKIIFMNAKEDESNSIYSHEVEEVSDESNSNCSYDTIQVEEEVREEIYIQVEEEVKEIQVEEEVKEEIQVEEEVQVEVVEEEVKEVIQVEEEVKEVIQVEEEVKEVIQVEEEVKEEIRVEEEIKEEIQVEEEVKEEIQVEEEVKEEIDVQVEKEKEVDAQVEEKVEVKKKAVDMQVEIKDESDSEKNDTPKSPSIVITEHDEYDEYDDVTLTKIRDSLPPPYNEYDIETLKKEPDFKIIINNYILQQEQQERQEQQEQQDNKQESESGFFSTFKKIVREVEGLVEKASKAHQAAVTEVKRLSIVSNKETENETEEKRLSIGSVNSISSNNSEKEIEKEIEKEEIEKDEIEKDEIEKDEIEKEETEKEEIEKEEIEKGEIENEIEKEEIEKEEIEKGKIENEIEKEEIEKEKDI